MTQGDKTPSLIEMQDVRHRDRDELSSSYSGFHGSETSYRDDKSFISSKTKKSRCSGRNACCLALFCIFAALLIAIGIAIMVYYVVLKVPQDTTSVSTSANGSLALMNLPFSADMTSSDSQNFKAISDTLCKKIGAYFQNSSYNSIYQSCNVEVLTADTTPLPCACSNITKPKTLDNSTRVFLNIMLKGDVPNTPSIVKEVIFNGATRKLGIDYDVVTIENLVVDIIAHGSPKPTTDINKCLLLPPICQHGGICENNLGSYTCTCLKGYIGVNCETDVNECIIVVCNNGGNCVNTPGSYKCNCAFGWSGITCDLAQASSFDIALETVGLTITPELLDKSSQQFLTTQASFCSNFSAFLRNVPAYQNYSGCSINSFNAGTRFVSWRITFNNVLPGDTGIIIRDLLLETRAKDKIRIGDVYAIAIGLVYVKHSDYVSTNVTILKRLLNFTYSTDLQDFNSPRFLSYQQTFCTAIQQMMNMNPSIFPNFEKCSITSYGLNPTTFTFVLNYGGIIDPTSIKTSFQTIFERDFPRVVFQQYQGINFGGLFIYLADVLNYTSVSFTFKLLSPTWMADMASSSSLQFQNLSSSFCGKMADLLRSSSGLSSFQSCTVTAFRNTVPLVEMDVALNFYEQLDLTKTRSRVSDAIVRYLPMVRQGNYIGSQIGYVLVLYDSIAVYYDIPYDGWIANFTFLLFDSSTYTPTLENPSSYDFIRKQEKFCNNNNGLNATFANSSLYGNRLLRCFVHHYEYNSSESQTQLRYKVVISLLLNKKDPIIYTELKSAIESYYKSNTINTTYGSYMLVGDDLVIVNRIDGIKVNISNYLISNTMTTPFSGKVSALSQLYRIDNIPLTADLRNSSSIVYQNYSFQFCQPIATLLRERPRDLPPFLDCQIADFVLNATDNKMYVKFNLRFNGDIVDAIATSDKVTKIITENVPRKTLADGTTIVLVMGPLNVILSALQVDITRPELITLVLTTTTRPFRR